MGKLKTYEPELGQALFGQDPQEYEVPRHVENALEKIAEELERISRGNQTPFDNSGEHFQNQIFEADAYSWSTDDQQYNFKWRDFEVSWYKCLGRGMSMNRDITEEETKKMLEGCLKSLQE